VKHTTHVKYSHWLFGCVKSRTFRGSGFIIT